MAGIFDFQGSRPTAKKVVENITQTAVPLEQLSEQARKNRRLRASVLTRGFTEPLLSSAGLLGLNLKAGNS